jgi:predicted transcriptional regulator of viral defense system
LATLAARQHGVVGRRQLLALGLGADAIKSRLASGRLHSIHRDAYAVGHRRLSQRGLWMAAVLGCGTGSVLSHGSAATLWGLEEARSPIDVTAPRGRQGSPRRVGIRLHRCRLEDSEWTRRDGIPVTTVARTLFDLAETAGADQLGRLWEEGDKLHLLVLDDVAEVYERRRGCRRARRRIRPLLLEAPHSERTRSPLEDRFAAFCRQFELPPPATNVLVLEKEVDAAWLAARLLVELDSWEHHAHRAAFERDRKRDVALIVAGYRTIRVTHRRLDREAATLAGEIRRLLTG